MSFKQSKKENSRKEKINNLSNKLSQTHFLPFMSFFLSQKMDSDINTSKQWVKDPHYCCQNDDFNLLIDLFSFIPFHFFFFFKMAFNKFLRISHTNTKMMNVQKMSMNGLKKDYKKCLRSNQILSIVVARKTARMEWNWENLLWWWGLIVSLPQ